MKGKIFSKLKKVRASMRASEGALTRDHVLWAYRLLLDREPESEAAIEGKLAAWSTPRQLRAEILNCDEFADANPDLVSVRERNLVIKELDHGVRLFVDLADQMIGMNIIKGRYEKDETAFVQRTVKPGQCALDLGANIGFYTMLLAGAVGPEGKVYAFEPLAENADLLERSMAENHF